MTTLFRILMLALLCYLSTAFVLQDLPLDRWERSDPMMFDRMIRSRPLNMYRHLPDRFIMFLILCVLSSFLVQLVHSGAVGECRTECVEHNKYKIVRVHLKDNWVMAGICRNTTGSSDNLATVIPFICDRNKGIWSFDERDEEGIVSFPVSCPRNHPVPPEQLHACPREFTN